MTTYKGINGFAVQSLATDPSPSIEGQVWYNNASYAFKLAAVTTAGAWATGGSLNTARNALVGAGTQTAALGFGGSTTAPVANTESYNGTSWTAVNALNTARGSGGGAGTQTSALLFGGYSTTPTGVTESWNGTSWATSPASLNTVRFQMMGCGASNTSALAFGGIGSPSVPTITGATESYNGSSWTNVNSLNTARRLGAGTGIITAALCFGGLTTAGYVGNTETWNGTSWSEANVLNTTRRNSAGNVGTNTAALASGGILTTDAVTAATESWNGTSWTTTTSMATARAASGGAGTNTVGLVFGGETPSVTGATEKWTGPGVAVTKTITTS
jgi:hypothetical protein